MTILLSGPRVRQADRPPCAPFQRAMDRPGVEDEVQARPREASEKLSWQEIALQAIAPSAGEDHVARNMGAAVRKWLHVVQRGEIEFERGGAVDAPAAAVAHGGAFDRSFQMSGGDWLGPAIRARDSGEGDAVKVTTS